MKGKALSALTTVVLVLGLGLPLVDRGIVPLDEGQVASFAVRILHGDVLYRDMYTGIFPGIYYATAGLFSVFGLDILVTRYAQLAVNLLTALCLWRLGARALPSAWQLAPGTLYALLVVWSFPVMTMLAYSSVSLLSGLAALLAAIRYAEKGSSLDALASGGLLAACALTKQNYGLLAGVAVLYTIVDAHRGRAFGRARLIRALTPVVAAGAVCSVAALGALAWAGAWSRFWRYTVATIASSQLEAFDQPIPPIFGAHPQDDGRFTFLYLPGILFGYLIRGETLFGIAISPAIRGAVIRAGYGGTLGLIALAPLVLWVTRRAVSEPSRAASRWLYVAAATSFLGMFPSAIWSHLAAVMPPVLLLGCIVAARVDLALSRNAPWLSTIFRSAAAIVLAVTMLVAVRVSLDVRRWNDTPLGLERGSIRIENGIARLLSGAVSYLERCAAPGEPILAAPDIPIVYFLTNRPNATPYEMMIPGDVEPDLLIDRLERSDTRCAVYNPRMYAHFAPLAAVYPEISRYVDERFERVVEIRGDGHRWYGLRRRESRL